MSAAWLGPSEVVWHILETKRADTLEEGGFRISDHRVVFGLGGVEVVIPDGTQYYVGGEPHDLVRDLRKTGEGLMVGAF